MKKNLIIIAVLFLSMASAVAQEKGFIVKGRVNMPDGTSVGVLCETDTSFAVEMANGYIKDGRFELQGSVDKPLKGTLITNNLELVEKYSWPTDSIRWTYTDIFLSNDEITVSPDLTMTGGQVQKDFNDLQAMEDGDPDRDWKFIGSHPNSSVAAYLAINLLKRGYNLTKEQVEYIGNTVDVPSDPKRMEELAERLAYAKKTTKGSPLVDLELTDVDGKVCHLVDVVPKNQMVLIDFWASWCGICLHSMPAVKALADKYKGGFSVIAVSIDTKEKNWRMAMEKHPEPWPQYMTTPQGYKDLFEKYQVGNGVPYYLMVSPEGTVITSPDGPEEAEEILKHYL